MAVLPKAFRPYQSIAVSIGLLLLCIVGVVVGVIPAVGKIEEQISAAKSLKEDTVSLSKKLSVLTAIDDQTVRTQLATVLSAVPADRSYPTIFETVEGVAAQTGVSVKTLNITGGGAIATSSGAKATAEEKKLGTRTVPFSVSVEGSLSNLEQFITLAPKVRRLLRIRVFSISYPKDDRPVNITIEMDGFYMPLPTTIGNVKATLPSLTDSDVSVIDKLSQFPLAVDQSAQLPPPLIGKVKESPFLQ